MKRQSYAPYALLALALVGTAVAFYDAHQLYNGQALWCPPPINGCNEVANSPYARIYNLPVGYFGVVYYLYMFGLAALLAFDPLSRGLRFAAPVYSRLRRVLLDLFPVFADRVHPRLLHLLSGLGGHDASSVHCGTVPFQSDKRIDAMIDPFRTSRDG